MRTAEELRNELRGMDRRSYPAYKALAGTWQFEKAKKMIDRIASNGWKVPENINRQEYRG